MRSSEAQEEIAKSRIIDSWSKLPDDDGSGQPTIKCGIMKHCSMQAGGQVASDPKEWTGHFNLGLGYQGTGKMVEAIAAYQKALEISEGNPPMPQPPWRRRMPELARGSRGKNSCGLGKKSKSVHVSPLYACHNLCKPLARRTKAFEFLEKASKERSLDITYHITKQDPRIDNLRSDAAFFTTSDASDWALPE